MIDRVNSSRLGARSVSLGELLWFPPFSQSARKEWGTQFCGGADKKQILRCAQNDNSVLIDQLRADDSRASGVAEHLVDFFQRCHGGLGAGAGYGDGGGCGGEHGGFEAGLAHCDGGGEGSVEGVACCG